MQKHCWEFQCYYHLKQHEDYEDFYHKLKNTDHRLLIRGCTYDFNSGEIWFTTPCCGENWQDAVDRLDEYLINDLGIKCHTIKKLKSITYEEQKVLY